jgi:3-methyladenine DNA glycosylase AlkC
MKTDFRTQEREAAAAILADLERSQALLAVEKLGALKNDLYAAIPDKKRQSRGITWVLMRLGLLLAASCRNLGHVRSVSDALFKSMELEDRLVGVPVYMMAEYGKSYPAEVLDFFRTAGGSGHWEVREFASSGFRRVIKTNRDVALPWLRQCAQNEDPNVRRFTSETLRPVVENRWLNNAPYPSLEILRLLFCEPHPYPRTSVGNNLSDLARHNPELILSIVQELVASENRNSYWIAYRACRNMINKQPEQIMDILRVDQYHYKDRRFYLSPNHAKDPMDTNNG